MKLLTFTRAYPLLAAALDRDAMRSNQAATLVLLRLSG
jgi:hypothetical protein